MGGGKIPGSLPVFLAASDRKLFEIWKWDYASSTLHTYTFVLPCLISLVDIMKLKDVPYHPHLNHIFYLCHLTGMGSTHNILTYTWLTIHHHGRWWITWRYSTRQTAPQETSVIWSQQATFTIDMIDKHLDACTLECSWQGKGYQRNSSLTQLLSFTPHSKWLFSCKWHEGCHHTLQLSCVADTYGYYININVCKQSSLT